MTVTTSPPTEAPADAAERINPFPGLRPFREDEESLFFGRESQVDSMVDKLAATRFLSVVGTSGSGKSSLVNCGLRPALHRGLMTQVGTTWRMAQFRPGADPVRAMAGALSQEGVLFRDYKSAGLTPAEIVDTTLRMSKVGLIDIFEQARLGDDVNLLVVVDQFEELFRYRQLQDGEQDSSAGVAEAAVAFVNLLLEAKEQSEHPIYVVLTMRSDFLGECAQIPGLAEAVNDGQYLVPRMTRDERRAAIAGPIAVGGAEIEPVLLTRLLNDVGDNPDQLSILQHALNRTWARWQHEGRAEGPIGLDHYKAIGTMSCALDRHAEKAFGELGSDEQKKLCERIFKALTDKATDPRGIRRPSAFQKLCELTGAQAAEAAAVLEVFRKPSRSFVMPPAEEELAPETVVDISHESLMRIWQRLNRWADEEAQSARIYRRLAEAAAQHEKNEAGLLRDPELQLALNWRKQNEPNESWASQYQPGFAPAMTYLADSEADRAKQRRNARLRIGVLVALVIISAAVGVVAVLKQREAASQRRDAENASNAATQLALTATANDSSVTPLGSALLLSLAAYQKNPSFDSRRSVVLSLAAAATQPLQLILRTHARASALALSRNGRIAATADRAGDVRLWNLRTHKKVGPTLHVVDPGSHTSTVHPSVAFSRDGSIAQGTDARLTLWNAAGHGVSLRDHATHIKGEVRTVAFSPDGKLLASSGFDGVVRLWNVKTHRLLHRFRTAKQRQTMNTVAFSPDGRMLAAAGDGGAVHVWYSKTYGPVTRLSLGDFSPAVTGVAFFPDDEVLATASEDGSIRGWDLHTHGPRTRKPFVTGRPFVDFGLSPDYRRQAAASDDGTVRIWSTYCSVLTSNHCTGALLFTATSPGSSTYRTVDFDKAGRLVSLSADGNITVWGQNPAAFGDALPGRVTGPPTNTDVITPQWVGSLDSLPAFAASPDGKTLVAGGYNGLRFWDAKTRKPLSSKSPAAKDPANAVAFSPDGKLLAEALVDGDVRLWRAGDLPRLVPVGRARVPGSFPLALALTFSPDGLLAFGDESGRVYLWDTRTPRTKPRLVGAGSDLSNPTSFASVYDVAFSPKGTMLASGGYDGTLRLWDVSAAAHPKMIGNPNDTKAPSAIRSVAFSPNGRLIAVGSTDGTISLRDATTRKQLRAATPDSDAVESVAFTARGQVLISVGDDGVVRFWDVDTLRPLGQLAKSHVGKIRRLVLTPEGVLATAQSNGSVRLWPGVVWSNTRALRARVCHLVARGIAPAEWNAIIPAGVKQPLPHPCGYVKHTS